MNDDAYRTGFPGRIWRFVLAVSEAAVAIHYHAPWSQTALTPARAVTTAPRRDDARLGSPCRT